MCDELYKQALGFALRVLVQVFVELSLEIYSSIR